MAKDNPAADQQIDDIDKQSTDRAGDDESGVDAAEAAGGTEDEDEESEDEEDEEEDSESDSDDEDEDSDEVTELISQDQFDKLKGDPDKLHKELVRAANKKFRDAANINRTLKPYAKFIAALDADPKRAVAKLAKNLGMKIEAGDDPESTAGRVGDELLDKVRELLGTEYGDLADKLVPAIRVIAEDIAEKAVQPVIRDSTARESRAAMQTFAKRHPDWKKHEKAMTRMSERMPPSEDMDEVEYLENIYYLVTRSGREGDAVKRVVTKMNKAAKNAGKKPSTLSDDKVAQRPTKLPTFGEAAAAAMKGTRFEF